MNIKGIHHMAPGSALRGSYFLQIGNKIIPYAGNIRYAGNTGYMSISGPPNTSVIAVMWDETHDGKRERYIEIYQNKGAEWPAEIEGFKKSQSLSLLEKCSFFDSVQIVAKDPCGDEYVYSMPDADVYEHKSSYVAAMSEVVLPDPRMITFLSETENMEHKDIPVSCTVTTLQL